MLCALEVVCTGKLSEKGTLPSQRKCSWQSNTGIHSSLSLLCLLAGPIHMQYSRYPNQDFNPDVTVLCAFHCFKYKYDSHTCEPNACVCSASRQCCWALCYLGEVCVPVLSEQVPQENIMWWSPDMLGSFL